MTNRGFQASEQKFNTALFFSYISMNTLLLLFIFFREKIMNIIHVLIWFTEDTNENVIKWQ